MNTSTPLFVLAGEREASCVCPHCRAAVARGAPVAVCPACGTVHHRACWETAGRCGAYACAPARIESGANHRAALHITDAELHAAQPLPPRRQPTFTGATPPPASLPRTNRLAIASLVCAIAGIPLFGVLTGLVAIVLGALAIGSIRVVPQRGNRLAAAGILLGLADMVGWILLLSGFFFSPGVHVALDDMEADPTFLEGLEPPLNRAMRASVLLESNRGGLWGSKVFGSGVVLGRAGQQVVLATNRHVVDPNFTGAGSRDAEPAALPPLLVKFVAGAATSGRVVWVAPGGVDLALVQTAWTTDEAQVARWEPNRPVHVGDLAFAIGNPHRLGWTHTQGVVSQLRRQTTNGHTVRIIQTQTALNPGNSGGGLFDREGFLIGINTWVNDKRFSEGLGFAISLDALLEFQPPDLAAPPREEKQP